MTRQQDATRDHLHPAMNNALLATQWIHKTIEYQVYAYSKSCSRNTLENAREELRECLASLDAFEAAAWPGVKSDTAENDAQVDA